MKKCDFHDRQPLNSMRNRFQSDWYIIEFVLLKAFLLKEVNESILESHRRK